MRECVRMYECVALCGEQNRDTVVTQSEVAVLFHIDTDLPCTRPALSLAISKSTLEE